MESEKKTIGQCPFCGGAIVKTCKGYRCENSIGESPSCKLYINTLIGNRKMSDEEIIALISREPVMFDGFASKEGKVFPAILVLESAENVSMKFTIGKCPRCGGDMLVGNRAFNCSNYSNTETPCAFSIWRNIGGHPLTLKEAQDICAKGMTEHEIEMYREDGCIYRKRLGISPDKLQVIKI